MFDKIITEFFLLNSCSNMWSLVEILSLDLIWQRALPAKAENMRTSKHLAGQWAKAIISIIVLVLVHKYGNIAQKFWKRNTPTYHL